MNQSLLFQRDVVDIIGFNTNGPFQTTDRRKAKSKMGEEEANQDLTGKRKMKEESSEVSSDIGDREGIVKTTGSRTSTPDRVGNKAVWGETKNQTCARWRGARPATSSRS